MAVLKKNNRALIGSGETLSIQYGTTGLLIHQLWVGLSVYSIDSSRTATPLNRELRFSPGMWSVPRGLLLSSFKKYVIG